MTALLGRVVRRGALERVRHVAPVPPGAARGLVADVYAQVERDFGMLAPPIALHSPAPDVLAAAWAMLRESLVASGAVSRTVKEAVAAAVSRRNACPYCLDVHGTMAYGLMTGPDAAAVAAGRTGEIADAEVRRAVVWAAGGLDDVPVPAGQAPELWGTAVTFHYLNRMVNVFLPGGLFPAGRSVPRRLIGLLTRPLVRGGRAPGASARLLAPAALPDDLGWASGNAAVRQAFAGAAAVLEQAGPAAVPDDVRELVRTELTARAGWPPGLGRGWADESAARLRPGERAAGRLALLTAIAAYQVDATVIDDFRRDAADDRRLVELTAWASFTAARHWASTAVRRALR
ncbi:carboxymuconolactone decarboxylase family protein [Nonomuraea helvata]|uniref:Carboxymuconolactone decarboxylase family protein n=1 Tax=Nonomuraea helvata TaxID=37484 RepID=A0ABV5S3X9_9ACTN